MKLIVGLGNPGSSYSANRHNVGYMCVNYLARQHEMKLDRSRGLARVGAGKIAGIDVVLARPQTFVNSSGESVKKLAEIYHASPPDIIIIHDDLDLPFGKIRIRQGGSTGGHNGIKSIIAWLGTSDFARIKIGIGRPEATDETSTDEREAMIVQYVLSDFSREEREIVNKVVPRVGEAVSVILNEGITAAMNTFNCSAS